VTGSLEGLGGVGLTLDAARLLGAAEALRETLGRSMSTGEREINALIAHAIQAAHGENASAEAWAEGRRLSLEQAVATALAMRDES